MTQARPAQLRPPFPGVDSQTLILLSVCALLAIGTSVIFSATSILPRTIEYKPHLYFFKHLIFVVTSIIVMLGFSLIDYRWLLKPKLLKFAVAVTFGLLVYVLLFGREVNGARRWVFIGGVSFQPSELAKVVSILALSVFLACRREQNSQFREGFLPAIGLVGLLCALIYLENDLGTPLLIGSVLAVVMLAAGIRWHHFLAFLPVVAAFLSYQLVWGGGFRSRRMQIYIDPWVEPDKGGYQIIQSMIAFHSGGLWGKGLGNSMQKQGFLPAHMTDFIFAVVGEELGFAGCALVIVLFGVLLFAGIKVIQRAPDLAGSLIAVGIVASIGMQALINMGVVTLLLPTKGIALPFMSLGGSSMIIAGASVGILMNIGKQGELPHAVELSPGQEYFEDVEYLQAEETAPL